MSDGLEEGERDRVFVESLSREERVLVLLRDQLYDGSWEDLELDLRARKERKPSIFKLNTRIEEDLDRIARLRSYEQERGLDLGALLASPSAGDLGGAQ
jgi:hypothetical protein